MTNLHFYPLRVKEIREETETCRSVVFEIPEDWKDIFQYKPGQYLTVKSPILGDEVRRSYSLCSCPEENEWRVAVKQLTGGQFSNFVHQNLQVGDILEVLPPMGHFSPTNSTSKKTYILVAAGSGITPVFSIAKNLLKSNPNCEVVLLYGNRNPSTIIFKEELEALKNKNMKRFSIYHFFSKDISEAEILNGRINSQKIHYFLRHFVDPQTEKEVFICGPEDLMLESKKAFIDAGLDPKNVHVELFFSAEADQLQKQRTQQELLANNSNTENDEAKNIKVQIDGRWMDFALAYPEQTLLDAALQNGADLPYACRGGVCATCKCKLEKGEVEMDINYALEDDELAQGFILACQSHPLTEMVQISFDFK